jgi:hypothetical protein
MLTSESIFHLRSFHAAFYESWILFCGQAAAFLHAFILTKRERERILGPWRQGYRARVFILYCTLHQWSADWDKRLELRGSAQMKMEMCHYDHLSTLVVRSCLLLYPLLQLQCVRFVCKRREEQRVFSICNVHTRRTLWSGKERRQILRIRQTVQNYMQTQFTHKIIKHRVTRFLLRVENETTVANGWYLGLDRVERRKIYFDSREVSATSRSRPG